MSTTRNALKDSPIIAITSQDQQNVFAFPESSHLVITTPRHVFAWDSTGIRTVFQSTRGGIVAAREAKDGSGVLAVASSNVVVMHDTKRGKEESWGLNAPDDEVRHLEYSPDAKSLFLSTTTDGTIQHYSTESSRLLDPAQKHDAAPVALAISPTGHMILSASQNPPVIYLKNLAHNTAPFHIQPSASKASVSSAAFHPERPNIFLLAFRDGVVAAFDASRMARKGASSSQRIASDGEISRLANVHRAIASGEDSLSIAAPIVGAAFLPGFKTRAVTAGRDGKCKIIDFANGGVVLRTWHAKAPITSISVLALKSNRTAVDSNRNRSSGSHTIGGPTSTNSLIALSRVDGKVHIYDSVGLLMAEKSISSMEDKILSVEWAKGRAPKALDGGIERHFSGATRISLGKDASPQNIALPESATSTADTRVLETSVNQNLGLPAALKRDATPRKFTLHPDEEALNTVRYTPSPNRDRATGPAVGTYNDLFSPVKPEEAIAKSPGKPRITSPPRNRPRLSSQTFIKSPEPDTLDNANVSKPRNLSLFPSGESHATSSGSSTKRPQELQRSTLKPPRKASTAVSPLSKAKKHITFANTGDGSITSRTRTAASAVSAPSNAKVLADLRKLAKEESSQQKQGTLSSYAASQRRPRTSAPSSTSRVRATQSIDGLSEAQTESTASSWSFQDATEDIWLTSDSEDDASQRRRRRRRPQERPPARQTSRSRVVSNGTVSTAAMQNAAVPPLTQAQAGHTDGSTEDDAFATARSELSPAGAFSPASERVRELFPRSSSLSPGKKKSPRKSPRRSPIGKENTLTRMAVNAAMGPQPKSPWARVKAGKKAKPVKVYEDPATKMYSMSGALPRSEGLTCLTCPETKVRVQGLESEVAQLKGEVIALKAMLRRNGLPFPACLRNR